MKKFKEKFKKLKKLNMKLCKVNLKTLHLTFTLTYYIALEKQSLEEKDMLETIQQLENQKLILEERRKELEIKAKEIEQQLNQKQILVEQRARLQKTQAIKNEPELAVFEIALGLKIVAPDDGILSFIFDHVDRNDVNKEFRFTVDVGSTEKNYTCM